MVRAEIDRGKECIADFGARLQRGFAHRLDRATTALESCSRMLESLSYRAILARGFVLVRGRADALRRRAAAVEQGERLTLTFADGEIKAVAVDATQPKSRRIGLFRNKTQGDLF
jgi:exodeoxyribonuclease VII large subunit